MTQTTPPPDEPMPEQVRARIRAELVAAAQAGRGSAGRWAVLAAASVSVVLVVGLTAWAVGAGDGADEDRGAPAASTTPAPPTDSQSPSAPTTDATPTPAETTDAALPPSPTPEQPEDECAREMKQVLKDAEPAFLFPGTGGSTSFWSSGREFTLCEVGAGTVTVHKPLPLEPDPDDVATFRVSTVFSPTEQGFQTIRVAGGLVPEGATTFEVSYTFPDGHTENATTGTDDQGRTWWRMLYAYDDGGGNEMKKPPIEVSVTMAGSGSGFTLDWALDTCAQANHGC